MIPVFAIPQAKPFRTNLPGRVRLRFRNDDFAEAFIRHDGTTRRFIIVDAGDHWTIDPSWEQGANRTIPVNLPDPIDHMPVQGIVFGARKTKAVKTSLPGLLTLHLRPDEFVRADIEHEGKVRCFMVADMGDHWELCLEHPSGCHYRPESDPPLLRLLEVLADEMKGPLSP